MAEDPEPKAIVLPLVHPDGSITIGGRDIPHQGITMDWSLETRSWTAVVRIPVFLTDDVGAHSALYVAGAGTGLAIIEEQGETPGLALYALAKAVTRSDDARPVINPNLPLVHDDVP